MRKSSIKQKSKSSGAVEQSLYDFMETEILRLKRTGRVRTSETYRTTLNCFRLYREGKDILLSDITSCEMQMFEGYMTGRGLCQNTTSFYMRILRAVYNRAVEDGVVEQRNPFRHVYTGIDRTVKRTVSVSCIRRIRDLKLPSGTSLALARDMFMFSFYTRGMSFVDIAFLRKSDIRDGLICYHRHKTGQLLTVKIEKCMSEIIDRYNDDVSPYLFPMVRDAQNGYRQYRNALRLMNLRLKKIGEMVDSPIKLTTYVGRHSWGNAAKTINIPLTVISESMGHNSETTTQIYLASLDTSVVDSANAKIIRELQGNME